MGATDPQYIAIVTSGIGLGTLALRSAFVLFAARRELNGRFLQALAFVPAAVFTGLIVVTAHPERIHIAGDPALPRVIALLLAALIAAKTKSVLLTIVGGMCCMWLLVWLFGLLGR